VAQPKRFWHVGLGVVLAGATLWGLGTPTTGSPAGQAQAPIGGISCPTGPGPGAGKEETMASTRTSSEATRASPLVEEARPEHTEVAVFALG